MEKVGKRGNGGKCNTSDTAEWSRDEVVCGSLQDMFVDSMQAELRSVFDLTGGGSLESVDGDLPGMQYCDVIFFIP